MREVLKVRAAVSERSEAEPAILAEAAKWFGENVSLMVFNVEVQADEEAFGDYLVTAEVSLRSAEPERLCGCGAYHDVHVD